MEIEKARELGLCFGVKRAIRMLKKAVGKYGSVETLGPLAHNQYLVEELAEMGIKPVDGLGQVRGKILAVTAHGLSPAVLAEIEARHIRVIDTTCPLVRRAQNAARELAGAGFAVIVFGEAEHPEVKGLLGWAGGKGIAALDVKQIDIASLFAVRGRGANLRRLGVISQTTQSQAAFSQFVAQLVVALPGMTMEQSREHFVSRDDGGMSGVEESEQAESGAGMVGEPVEEMRIVNTLCRVTQIRREAAIELAGRSQLMIVVGGYNSANTRRLAEACLPVVETHLVERASEVDSSWLLGKHHVGITAGASTPSRAIEEVIARLKSL